MKTRIQTTIRAAVGALVLLQASAMLRAEDAKSVRYEAQPTGSKMRIDGTAEVAKIDKEWHMDSVLIGGYMEADAKFPESALTDANAAKPVVDVFMPVSSFKSGTASMDKRMQKEMKEAQYKRITYKLIGLKPTSPAGSTGALKFDATGALTVAGKTLTNTMPVTIEKLSDGKLKVKGSTAVKMSDYGIPPPSSFGLFTSGDEVKLTFEWLAAPKADAPKAQ
ncbi:MAG TPA: YceI family protein [Verrucomicrobiae bacterium]|nr:YceI family protein [Verrucomicrobiae bacterium]